jgi:hypothetical protein
MNLQAALEFLFGCHHGNLSRVFTIRRRTYRVCCDCGAELDYSLQRMAIKPRRLHVPQLEIVNGAGHAPA